MTTDNAEDSLAVMLYIEAFFEGFDKKIAFLSELYEMKRRDEACVLCACYIDWLASALYWPDERNNFNFVRVLMEFGGNEIFSYIHPKMLEDAIQNKTIKRTKPVLKWTAIYDKISPALQKAYGRLYDQKEIISLLPPLVSSPEIENIKKELWRGTYAAIVYVKFRNPAVHEFGPPSGTTFQNTLFKGQQVPAIDFKMLYTSLKLIAAIAQGKSITSKKWFGHDYETSDQG